MPVAAAAPDAGAFPGLLDTSSLGAKSPIAHHADVFPAPEGFVPIHAVQYDERVRILAVEFADGACYHFLDVPEPVYLQLVAAPSSTAYFREHVAGRYGFRQME